MKYKSSRFTSLQVKANYKMCYYYSFIFKKVKGQADISLLPQM